MLSIEIGPEDVRENLPAKKWTYSSAETYWISPSDPMAVKLTSLMMMLLPSGTVTLPTVIVIALSPSSRRVASVLTA